MAHQHRGTTALITGASSGLGEEFARQLAARGANLVLVARRLDRLEATAAQLGAEHGVRVTVIARDLTADGAAAELHSELKSRSIHIDTLINNAGFTTRNRFEDEDAARIHAEITLNVTALVELTHAVYPDLLAAGAGAIVNVASTAGFQPVPLQAVYGASKAFVLSFTEALWYEAKGTGVKVLALSPGATKTEFFDEVGEGAQVGSAQLPAEVVSVALATLDKRTPPPSVVSGFSNRVTTVLTKLLPRRAVLNITGSLTGRTPVASPVTARSA